MKRTAISLISLVLMLALLSGICCIPASAATTIPSFVILDEGGTFPESPYDFLVTLTAICNALPYPRRVEMEIVEGWNGPDSPDVMLFNIYDSYEEGTCLLTIDFDQLQVRSNGTTMRVQMSSSQLYEKCDFINTYPRFVGMEMEQRYFENNVLEAQMLVNMVCDPQLKLFSGKQDYIDTVYTVIEKGSIANNGIILDVDAYASYGVMLSLRDIETEDSSPTHH